VKKVRNLDKQKTNNLINYLVLIWAILAAYFAFTDLQISISVVNQNSVWAKFLQNFGEVPGLLVLYVSTMIYLSFYTSSSLIRKYSLLFFLLLAATYLLSHMIAVIYHGFTDNYSFIQRYKIILVLFLLACNFLLRVILKNFSVSQKTKLFAKSSILLGLYGYLFIVQPIKHLWGRVRFRDLDALHTNFTPWFFPNGINGNQSFPSGHAAMAWMILPLLLLVVNKSRNVKISVLILITFWGLAVSLSRVVIGAHYASDVLWGSIIIIVVFLVITKSYWETAKTVS
jgi:membrane-associated phospholipid phosphatase